MICLPDPDASVIARRASIVRALRGLVAPANVIEDDVRLAAYETDAMTAYRRRPLAVVLPETTAEVAAILDYADREGVKIVPRGAGTSLSGGAIPAEDAIVVGLGKFNRILDIDYANRCVVAQSGVTSSTPSTLFVVKPYFKQCTPPEFSATLPPIVQAIWLEGSGA